MNGTGFGRVRPMLLVWNWSSSFSHRDVVTVLYVRSGDGGSVRPRELTSLGTLQWANEDEILNLLVSLDPYGRLRSNPQ